jgi:hypothetical protein
MVLFPAKWRRIEVIGGRAADIGTLDSCNCRLVHTINSQSLRLFKGQMFVAQGFCIAVRGICHGGFGLATLSYNDVTWQRRR